MIPEQTFSTLAPEALVEAVRERKAAEWRLVQICCTRLAGFELTYSFARPGQFEHLRVELPDAAQPVPSISGVYGCAFAYENEIHDLFGVSFAGLTIDYQGSFYKTTIPAPFGAAPACGVAVKAEVGGQKSEISGKVAS